jgi:hypothetical protein
MTSRDFVYWLQGFFEISETDNLTEKQVKMVKAHLNLVFKHEIDPSNLDGKTDLEKQEYIEIHRGKKDGEPFDLAGFKKKLEDITRDSKPTTPKVKPDILKPYPYSVQFNC